MDGGENTRDVLAVARQTKRRAGFLARKSFIQPHDVYRLAKEFFKAFLDKQIEFTSQELHEELHKVYLTPRVRDRVEAFVEKMSLMEYSESQLPQDEVKTLLNDLQSIIDDLVREHKEKIPWLTRFAHWLFHKKPTQSVSYLAEFPAIESNDPVSIDLNSLLEEIYYALENGKISRAHRKYSKLIDRYHQLGSHAQHEFYHKVHAAYQRILESGKK